MTLKKKFLTIACSLVAVVCLFLGITMMGNNKTINTAEAATTDGVYDVALTGTHAWFGQNELDTIQEGETLVMEWTTVSASIPTGNYNVGFSISNQGSAAYEYPYQAGFLFGSNPAYAPNIKTRLPGGNNTGGTITIQTEDVPCIPSNYVKVGYVTRCVYTPYDTANSTAGKIEIFTKAPDGDFELFSWASLDDAKSGKSNVRMSFFLGASDASGPLKMRIKDFRIYSGSKNYNVVTLQCAEGATNAKMTKVYEQGNYVNIVSTSTNSFTRSEKILKTAGKVVAMEFNPSNFTVRSGNVWFGFFLTTSGVYGTWNIETVRAPYNYSGAGMVYYQNGSWGISGPASNGAFQNSTLTKDNYVTPFGIMGGGKRVKLELDIENSTFALYTKDILSKEYGDPVFIADNVTVPDNVFIGLNWQNAFNMTLDKLVWSVDGSPLETAGYIYDSGRATVKTEKPEVTTNGNRVLTLQAGAKSSVIVGYDYALAKSQEFRFTRVSGTTGELVFSKNPDFSTIDWNKTLQWPDYIDFKVTDTDGTVRVYNVTDGKEQGIDGKGIGADGWYVGFRLTNNSAQTAIFQIDNVKAGYSSTYNVINYDFNDCDLKDFTIRTTGNATAYIKEYEDVDVMYYGANGDILNEQKVVYGENAVAPTGEYLNPEEIEALSINIKTQKGIMLRDDNVVRRTLTLVNGQFSDGTTSKKIVVGESEMIIADGMQQGYEFLGWYNGDTKLASDEQLEFTMIDEDITLTAKYLRVEKMSEAHYHIATSGRASFGPDRSIVLQDGEVMTMQFTIDSWSYGSGNTYGIVACSLGGSVVNYPYNNSDAFGFLDNGYGSTYTVGDIPAESFTLKGGMVFNSGREMKIEYKPYYSATDKGYLRVYYRAAGTNDAWTLRTEISNVPENKATRTNNIYVWFSAGDVDMTISNYTITTSSGANLLKFYGEDAYVVEKAGGRENCTQYHNVGLISIYDSSNVPTIEVAGLNQYEMKFTNSNYITPNVTANLQNNQQLVFEYDVVDMSWETGSGNLGFGFGPYANSGNVSDYTSFFMLYCNHPSNPMTYTGPYASGGSVTTDITLKNLYTAGNRIKVVYTPEMNGVKGSMIVYKKLSTATDDTYVFASGITNLATAPMDASIRIYVANNSFHPTIGNVEYYAYDMTTGEKTTVMDLSRAPATSFLRVGTLGDGYTTASPMSEEITLINDLPEEKAITFTKNNGTTTNYVAYVEEGAEYVIPSNYFVKGETDYKVPFMTIDGEVVKGGDVITVEDDITVVPYGIEFTLSDGAQIRTNDPMGLRFGVASVDKDAYDGLEVFGATDIQTGILIIPTDTLTVEFTKEALDDASIHYSDVVNVGWANNLIAEEQGEYKYYGSLTNIRDYNIGRDFSARAYLSFELDGDTYIIYTATIAENSIYEVAKAVTELGMGSDTISAMYLDKFVEIEGGELVEIENYTRNYTLTFNDNVYTITPNGAYVLPTVMTASIDGNLYKVTVSGNVGTITVAD